MKLGTRHCSGNGGCFRDRQWSTWETKSGLWRDSWIFSSPPTLEEHFQRQLSPLWGPHTRTQLCSSLSSLSDHVCSSSHHAHTPARGPGRPLCLLPPDPPAQNHTCASRPHPKEICSLQGDPSTTPSFLPRTSRTAMLVTAGTSMSHDGASLLSHPATFTQDPRPKALGTRITGEVLVGSSNLILFLGPASSSSLWHLRCFEIKKRLTGILTQTCQHFWCKARKRGLTVTFTELHWRQATENFLSQDSIFFCRTRRQRA